MDERKNMVKESGVNWDDLPSNLKWGFTVFKNPVVRNGANRYEWKADLNVPYFTDNRDYFQERIWSQMEN